MEQKGKDIRQGKTKDIGRAKGLPSNMKDVRCPVDGGTMKATGIGRVLECILCGFLGRPM